MQFTLKELPLKEFRNLAQGLQAMVTAGAMVAAVALAWYAFRTYQRTHQAEIEAPAE